MPLGASGAHTVVLSANSATNVWYCDIVVFDGDESKGLHMYDPALSGSKTNDYLNPATRSAALGMEVALIQPSLVVIGLLINDERNNIDPAAYQANLETLVGIINDNTTVDPTIILPEPWREATAYGFPHSDYWTRCEPWPRTIPTPSAST